MKKWWLIPALLLLTGCAALPRPREMENMALLRTLGVDYEAGMYCLTASGASGGGEQLLTGRGPDPETAMAQLRASGQSVVFLGYVDQVLLGSGLEEYEPLLEYLSRDRELSLGVNLWLVSGSAEEAVSAPETEQRLNTLALEGTAPPSAGEVYGALLDGNEPRLPVLTLRAGLLSPVGRAGIQTLRR